MFDETPKMPWRTYLTIMVITFLAFPHLVGWISWLRVESPAICIESGGWELLVSSYAPCNKWSHVRS
jgi:hypothetical protein